MDKEIAKQLILGGLDVMKGFPSWVDAGTLLGIVRDRTIIKHDTDIDIAVSLSQSEINTIPTLERIGSWDAEPLRVTNWHGLPMQQTYLVNGQVLDFFFFYNDFEDGRLINVNDHGVMRVPSKFVATLQPLVWEELQIRVPDQTPDYLAWRYGEDWLVPKRFKGDWGLDHPNLERLSASTPLASKISEPVLPRTNSPFVDLLDIELFGDLKTYGLEIRQKQATMSLLGERDALLGERDALLGERDALLGERDALLGERDALLGERDALLVERDALLGERDALLGERDALLVERDALLVERDAAHFQLLDVTTVLEQINSSKFWRMGVRLNIVSRVK